MKKTKWSFRGVVGDFNTTQFYGDYNPSLPVISPEVRCLDGMFKGSKYLLTFGVWKPREMVPSRKTNGWNPKIDGLVKWFSFSSRGINGDGSHGT